jgi:threonine/homoserine/homoserine lactone efflux protein
MAGGVSGLMVHAGAAAVGVSALLATSETAFTALKVVGVAYLVWLGARMLFGGKEEPTEAGLRNRPFTQGFVSNALNPKVALFFVTFLPQFLPDGGATAPAALGLSALFAALYLAWFTGLVAVVESVGEALRRPRVRARLERVSGGALVAFGLRLAVQG